MKARMLGAVALGVLVAACGTNPQERVTGGAAAGAATGAGIGALGGPAGALAGAAIGGGAGAVTGAVTEPSTVNLGRPVWNDPEVRLPGTDGGRSASGSGSAQASGQTRQLQQALSARGFDPGPVDGVYGPRTREAVMNYQRANNMEATGRPNAQMMSSLNISGGSNMASGSNRSGRMSDRDRAYMGGGMVVDQQTGSGSNMGGTGSGGMSGGSSMGGSGSMGNTGSMGGQGSMGNTGAGGQLGNQSRGIPQTGAGSGMGGTLGGGRGAPTTNASPDNPGTGSNSAGSSSQ
jgi:peptidoglycan hydrolase-like protein with peptidoglycan-binding domain